MNIIKHKVEIEPIFKQANEKGKTYLLDLIKRNSIIGVFNTIDNWFYVFTDEDLVFYISQKYDCDSGCFGDSDHFIKEYTILNPKI